MGVFRFFEGLLEPTALPPEAPPPAGLAAFYWHYARQASPLVVALFVAGFIVAMLDTTIPLFIGRVVTLVSTHAPASLLHDAAPQLLGMAAVVLLLRPMALLVQAVITNQAIAPGLTNLIRWQSHWHVVRQSWTFFQNDFAGRIANRIMQTGPSLRESVVAGTNAVWYILVYGGGAIALMASNDIRLAVPVLLWFVGYAVLLRAFVPRMRDRSRRMSEVRSALTGRVVDSYTNILTVKLFARPSDEDAFVRAAVDEHTRAFRRQLRLITLFGFTLTTLNATMVVSTGVVAIWLWTDGRIALGTVAMALPLTWQISNIAGWVAQNVTSIFENVGTVQDGMRSIAVPRQMPDRLDAPALHVERGEVRFEDLRFGYGTARGVLHGINLAIAPGERVGLVGRSGAGKSTLVNLLLRFYEIEAGRILIDGQDIAGVTQESLRAHIAMVTQDTSLLHRSIRENIAYGRPERQRGGSARRRRPRPCPRVHRDAGGLAGPPRLRRPCGRARREAVRRPAPAHRAGARDPEGRADPGSGRGDLGARFRGRGGDPGAARRPHARAHSDRHRAPPLHHRAHGPPRGAGSRPCRGGRHPRRASGRGRRLCPALAAAIRRLLRSGSRRARRRAGGAIAGGAPAP